MNTLFYNNEPMHFSKVKVNAFVKRIKKHMDSEDFSECSKLDVKILTEIALNCSFPDDLFDLQSFARKAFMALNVWRFRSVAGSKEKVEELSA